MVTYFIYIFHFVLNSKILRQSPFLPCSFLPLSLSFILFCLSDSGALSTWGVWGGPACCDLPTPCGKELFF